MATAEKGPRMETQGLNQQEKRSRNLDWFVDQLLRVIFIAGTRRLPFLVIFVDDCAGSHPFTVPFPLQYVMESRYSSMHRRGRLVISCWLLNAVVLLSIMDPFPKLCYRICKAYLPCVCNWRRQLNGLSEFWDVMLQTCSKKRQHSWCSSVLR